MLLFFSLVPYDHPVLLLLMKDWAHNRRLDSSPLIFKGGPVTMRVPQKIYSEFNK